MFRPCSKGCILLLDFLSTKLVINSQAVALELGRITDDSIASVFRQQIQGRV